MYKYVHAYTHTYTYSHTCAHTKIASKIKRNAKYVSHRNFCQSSKPACSSGPLDGPFRKATTRTAYRGSRSPSFREWQEFSPLSDNPERKERQRYRIKISSEAVPRARAATLQTGRAQQQHLPQGMGERAPDLHLLFFGLSLFFMFTLWAPQEVKNLSVFSSSCSCQHVLALQPLFCTLQGGDLLDWKLRISSSNT